MLDHDKGCPRIHRTGLKEFFQRIKATGRGTDTHNVSVKAFGFFN